MEYKKIGDYLRNKKLPLSVKGFDYLVRAIMIKYNDSSLRPMEIYLEVAQQKNTTVSAVERAIRHAIRSAGYEMTIGEFIAQTVYELTYK